MQFSYSMQFQCYPYQSNYPLAFSYQPIYILSPPFQNLHQISSNITVNQENSAREQKSESIPYNIVPVHPLTSSKVVAHQKNESKGPVKRGRRKNISNDIYIQDVQNRNILPNNLNIIFSYIRRANKSSKIVKKIINRLDKSQKFSEKFFYSYQIYLKERILSESNKSVLRAITTHVDPSLSVFSVEEQLFYNKVCRILISQFLRSDHILILLTNTKISKTKKTDHLKMNRYLLSKLKDESQEKNFQNFAQQ